MKDLAPLTILNGRIVLPEANRRAGACAAKATGSLPWARMWPRRMATGWSTPGAR